MACRNRTDALPDARPLTGKENILFRIASVSSQSPGGIVEDVVFPAAGGLDVLLDLVREFETKGPTYRQARQRSFKSSYSNHYRAGLIQILEALEFRSDNTVHRPVPEALELIKRYKAERSPSTVYYARGEHVPVDGVIPRDLADLLHKTDKRGRQRAQRTVYECGVFQTLRDKLRCKEIWVVGADRWRNPDEDLPADFEGRRAEYYASLRKPLDPQAFTAQLRAEMEEALADLNDHLPELDWVEIKERKAGPIVLTDLESVPEPRNLRRLKTAIRDRWGMVPLLDMLPAAGDLDRYPRLRPALTNPVRWGLIEQNYDLMVKYATAIRLGTASTEAILRRFNSDVTHPAYAAMLEVGRAQRTIFTARYLRDRDLQREINAGLNVVENYNGVNDYIFFGKSGELSTNRREEQEISMICLQILQGCLGYVNTLMIQDTLAEPEWADRLGDADRRGLTPLFTVNMTPYGEIQLNLDRRLDLAAGGGPGQGTSG